MRTIRQALGLTTVALAFLARPPAVAADDPEPTRQGIDFAAAQRHWAYQPVRKPALPAVKNPTWAAAPMDRFILARLEASGLSPSPPADRRTLLRRASFDLIGLPPTAAEVEAFEQDAS